MKIFTTIVLATTIVPVWIGQDKKLTEVGKPISASIVNLVNPNAKRFVKSVADCYNELDSALDLYGKIPSLAHLQSVQAMTNCIEMNTEQIEELPEIVKSKDTTVKMVVQLLDQLADELCTNVPIEPAVQPMLKKERIEKRVKGVKNWNASYFKNKFNAIVAGDKRFNSIK